MNNPNPFIPQGSLVEQMNKKRARVKMAVLAIFSGTIVLIAPVLLVGTLAHGAGKGKTLDDLKRVPGLDAVKIESKKDRLEF